MVISDVSISFPLITAVGFPPIILTWLMVPLTTSPLVSFAVAGLPISVAACTSICEPVSASICSVSASIGALPGELRIFVELPLLDDPRRMLTEIRAAGAWAKMRTGGVTSDAFPSAREVGRFIARTSELLVPFKATAGLHHPVCGEYPLTYEDGAPQARMFGFLNIFAAAAFAQVRASERVLTEIVDESDASAFRFADDEMLWRDHKVSTRQVASARSSLGLAFGSCSFQEPADSLRELGLL